MRNKHSKINTDVMSFYPAVPKSWAIDAFLESLEKDDSKNCYGATFAKVASNMMRGGSGTTFSLDSILQDCRPFDIPPHQVVKLFDKFVKALKTNDKVNEIFGAYDAPIYQLT